jgi:aspartate/methionine/tyrosine aminotransferase
MKTATRLDHLEVTLIREFISGASDGVVNLGLGQTNEPIPTCITERIAEPGKIAYAPYGPNAGFPELRAQIAERAGVAASRVVITAGVQEAIYLTMMTMVEPGMKVAVPNPGFPVYGSIAKICGAEVVEYSLREEDAFRPTPEIIGEVLDKEVDLIALCSPGNPTGAVATEESWAEIAELLADASIPVLSDEIYLPFQADGVPSHPSMLKLYPRTFCAAGLSKTHGMAGWRIGWLIVPEEVVGKVVALHQHVMTSVSGIVQQAALGAFTDAGDRAVEELNQRLKKKRSMITGALADSRWIVAGGDGAFYLWLRHPAFEDGLELATHLRDECGVLTIPGVAFGSAGEAYTRVSYSVNEEVLARGVDRLLSIEA